MLKTFHERTTARKIVIQNVHTCNVKRRAVYPFLTLDHHSNLLQEQYKANTLIAQINTVIA